MVSNCDQKFATVTNCYLNVERLDAVDAVPAAARLGAAVIVLVVVRGIVELCLARSCSSTDAAVDLLDAATEVGFIRFCGKSV